jgi:uncharacterized phage protein (TIGR01671 family)
LKNKYIGMKAGDWIYGHFFKCNKNKSWITIINKDGEYGDVEVIPGTVGQYIGLKDKNDTEIYEGDIVEISNEGWDGRASQITIFTQQLIVKYIDGSFVGKRIPGKQGNGYVTIYDKLFEKTEVVGNIPQNPELVEAEK